MKCHERKQEGFELPTLKVYLSMCLSVHRHIEYLKLEAMLEGLGDLE
jgi:hypothetical protein